LLLSFFLGGFNDLLSLLGRLSCLTGCTLGALSGCIRGALSGCIRGALFFPSNRTLFLIFSPIDADSCNAFFGCSSLTLLLAIEFSSLKQRPSYNFVLKLKHFFFFYPSIRSGSKFNPFDDKSALLVVIRSSPSSFLIIDNIFFNFL
jgi:hypothetical protein